MLVQLKDTGGFCVGFMAPGMELFKERECPYLIVGNMNAKPLLDDGNEVDTKELWQAKLAKLQDCNDAVAIEIVNEEQPGYIAQALTAIAAAVSKLLLKTQAEAQAKQPRPEWN